MGERRVRHQRRTVRGRSRRLGDAVAGWEDEGWDVESWEEGRFLSKVVLRRQTRRRRWAAPAQAWVSITVVAALLVTVAVVVRSGYFSEVRQDARAAVGALEKADLAAAGEHLAGTWAHLPEGFS